MVGTVKYVDVLPNRFTLAASFLSQTAGFATTLVLLTVVTFIVGNVIPIDAALTMVGDRASNEAYDLAREQLGLNLPLYQRYFHYLGNLVTGDLGTSLVTGNPVLSDLLQVFPATVELSMIAMTIGTVGGVLSGVWAAHHRDKWQDKMLRLFSVVGYSTPIFWLGLVTLLVFYYQLGWVEGPGRIDIGFDFAPVITGFVLIDGLLLGDLRMFGNAVSHIALPATVLGFATMAYIARMTRGFMVVQLDQEYAVAARAKGLSARTILWRHAFRNIRPQLITVLALSLGGLLEGVILTETVFSWPGLGLYMKLSLFNGDLNAVLGATLLVGIIYVGLSFLADALTAAIDPTVRAGAGDSAQRPGHIGVSIVAAFLVQAVIGPMVTGSATVQDLAQRLSPPSPAHLFGTDDLGRDILARITLACRSALLMIAIVCALIAPIGLVVGMVAGYFGGLLDVVLMRLTDVFLAFPRLVLALALAAALGPGFGNTVFAMVITSWPAYARLSRTETLLIRDSEFIESATLQGASPLYILTHHIAPLCTPTILLRLTLDVAAIILTAAGLGFLGLGAQPPAPELGTMVAEGRDFLYQQWWVATVPGAAILLLSLGSNLIGEGVRDAVSR